jgi:pimeloyl-ACP methyl ester carboxylesterase
MSRSIKGLLPIVVVTLAFSPFRSSVAGQPSGFEGTWIYSSISNLSSDTMVVTFTQHLDGAYSARVIVPEIRLDASFTEVILTDGVMRINNQGQPMFEATLGSDGSHLEGRLWIGSWLPVTLLRSDEPITFNRPQDPVGPFPYAEELVVFNSGDIRLSGTLTLPAGNRPAPAVVVLSGSGADNRDYLVAGHYPFWVIADYLTRLGIAVLRFDDRGVGASEGEFGAATTGDLAVDALSAVAYLQSRPEIDPNLVGLIGHSDGAGGAALAAATSSNVAFIVMLGGLGVTGEEHLLLQAASTWRALGANDALIDWQVEVQRGLIDVLNSESNPAALQQALDAYVTRVNAELTPEYLAAAGLPPGFPGIGFIAGSTAWLQYLIAYDPREALLHVECPVLALGGDLDAIVSSAENLAAIEKALADGGNADYTVVELPGLNHFFQTCQSGAPAEYIWIEETIAPEVLTLLGDWIAARTDFDAADTERLTESPSLPSRRDPLSAGARLGAHP